MASLGGIVPPIVAPFDAQENLDEDALRADLRHLAAQARVHGLVVGGSTGEGHTLTTDELRYIIGLAVEDAQGRASSLPARLPIASDRLWSEAELWPTWALLLSRARQSTFCPGRMTR
jgi:Dihydrodipicolinate synthetase family